MTERKVGAETCPASILHPFGRTTHPLRTSLTSDNTQEGSVRDFDLQLKWSLLLNVTEPEMVAFPAAWLFLTGPESAVSFPECRCTWPGGGIE